MTNITFSSPFITPKPNNSLYKLFTPLFLSRDAKYNVINSYQRRFDANLSFVSPLFQIITSLFQSDRVFLLHTPEIPRNLEISVLV